MGNASGIPSRAQQVHPAKSKPLCDVFLGGSCNPTTWRKKIAIPMLESAKVTYYNPQVDDWDPSLEETERRYKNNSRYILFVIDDQTRAIASIQEASFCIGRGMNVVLVIKKIQHPPEGISANELKDLNRGRTYLEADAKANNVPLFDEVNHAIKYIIGDIKKSQMTSKT
jgi:hypothetical protein